MTSSRYIRARVVDFSQPNFAGEEVGAGRPRNAKDRKIRAKLRRARAIKRRIAHLRIRKPLGWKGALKQKKVNLRVVMSDLRALGWKPKKATRPRKPGEDEMDAALEDLPEAEPGEAELPDDEIEEIPDLPETEGEGNWLDGYLGAEPARPKRNLLQEAGKLFASKWNKPVPLGDGARIQTKPGQRAMVATVSPGLFIVQLVSDKAAKTIAGDNIGVLPLLLYPLVKSRILQKLTQPAATPAATPAPAPGAAPAPSPAPAPVGCDDCRGRY
ncbi:MAG: hypothetical protein Q8P41_25755 [Pseudomonadota bacterium]|nr:hypothetical protein [Pseudomonadota bacterium]